MIETCLILNRWTDDFARYERIIDHNRIAVAYLTVREHAAGLPAGLAHRVEVIDRPGDRQAVFGAAQRCVDTLGRLDRIIALSEFDLILAAELRERFGVAGHHVVDVLRFRDKLAMKQAVADAGLAVPLAADLDDGVAVARVVAAVGFPLIVKPRQGAASQGCLRVDDRNGLEREIGWRQGQGHEVEQFVAGPILHVDGLVANGSPSFMWVWRYVNTCYDFANGLPLGSVMVPVADAVPSMEFTRRVLRALDLVCGAFHLEIIEGPTGLCFLEIGARVGGGEIPFVVRDVFGVDLVGDWLRMEIGEKAETVHSVQAASAELGGFLMVPEPVGYRLAAFEDPMGRVDGLYAAAIPPLGHRFDGTGGYETILGRFRFRGDTPAKITNAVQDTLECFRYQLEK